MPVKIIRVGANGKKKVAVLKPKGPPPVSYIDKCKLKKGDVLLCAKGENKGVVIKSVDPLLDEVVVQDIDTQGKYGLRTMSAYQCAMVDFYPVSPPYDVWVVRATEGRAAAAKLK